jgi:hypothetical protein
MDGLFRLPHVPGDKAAEWHVQSIPAPGLLPRIQLLFPINFSVVGSQELEVTTYNPGYLPGKSEETTLQQGLNGILDQVRCIC